MAFIVPVVAAFSTVAAAGSVAAAVSTLGGFLTVAGGVLAGVGALTGKKDLVKIGSFMTLGAGVANAMSSSASTAAGGASEAFGAAESAAQSDLAQFAKYASDGGAGLKAAADTAATTAASLGTGIDAVRNVGIDATGGMETAIQPKTMSMADRAAQITGGASPTSGQAFTPRPSPIVEGAGGFNFNDLNSWWEKAKMAGKGVGQFVKQNPELVKIGGEVLNSMYGPEAEAADYQRSIYERARRNLNSPVVLQYRSGT